jgi:hypothetical protein
MQRSISKIIKRGSQWCVVCKDGAKNLGCFPTEQEARKRLNEVEFFKKKSGAMDKLEQMFEKLGKGQNDNLAKALKKERIGTVAGEESPHIRDRASHFPIRTTDQARSAAHRVMNLSQSPDWFGGSYVELREIVLAGIKKNFPDLQISMSMNIEEALAAGTDLVGVKPGVEDPQNDGGKTPVKDPVKPDQKSVPSELETPNLSNTGNKNDSQQIVKTLASSQSSRLAMAGTLTDLLQGQKQDLETAIALAKRLAEKGLTGEEFEKLFIYLQEDILRELVHSGTVASERPGLLQQIIDKKNG